MDLAIGNIELSVRYIKKRNCGHTLYKETTALELTAANVKLGGHIVRVLRNMHWGVAVD